MADAGRDIEALEMPAALIASALACGVIIYDPWYNGPASDITRGR
jgi:hypothetical protein